MRPPAMVSARKRTASFGCLARAAPTAMAMTALLEIRAKVMNVIKTMLKTSVCLGHSWLIPLTKPYAIKNPANVRASEMMKIHIMNLLQLVPNGDFPPPQSEANTRCCSAKVASINSLHLLSARFPKYGHVYALTRRFAAPSPRGRGTNLPNGPSPPGRRWPEGPDEGKSKP